MNRTLLSIAMCHELSRTKEHAILRRMSAPPFPIKHPHCTEMTSLIQLMAAGDEAALGQLYELALSHVYGIAFKFTGRHDLAEDVCIETFWQSWRDAR